MPPMAQGEEPSAASPEIFATPSDVAAPALSERSPLESGEVWRSYELVDDLVDESTQIS